MEFENSNHSSITSNLLTGPLDFSEFDSLTDSCSAANLQSTSATNLNNNHNEQNTQTNVPQSLSSSSEQPRKCSAAHRKLEILMASGKITNLPVRSGDDKRTEINLVDACEDKENVSETDAWFLKKLGMNAITVHKEKETDSKERMTSDKYKKVRQQMEEQMSVRRREEMERRHCFYNADNEIFNEDEEEEEEGDISDEEVEEKDDAAKAKEEEDEVKDEEEEMEEKEEEDETNDEEVQDDDDEGDNCRKKRKIVEDDSEDVDENPKKRARFDETNGADDEDDFSADINVVIDEDCSNSAAYMEEHRLQTTAAGDTANDASANDVVAGGLPTGFLHGSSSNEFSHISLDLSGADDAMSGPNPSASQDFNEALFLCSGTFGENVENVAKPSEEVSSNTPADPALQKLFNDDQLFTVDDDGDGNFANDWPDENEWNNNSKVYEEDDVNEENTSDDDDDDDEDAQPGKRRIKISDVLDDEASLSGDDVGSEDSDNSDNDEYDEEEGDKDDLPDDEVIRENLVKQYLKQTNDDEERRMLRLQEQFFVDADLHGTKNMDRSFRFRMRDDSNVDWSKVLGKLETEGHDGSDCDDADAEGDVGRSEISELREKKVEMLKWKLEQEKKKTVVNNSSGVEYVEIFAQSSLLTLGEKLIFSDAASTSTSSRGQSGVEGGELSSLIKRDSLLTKASSLGHVLRESSAMEVRTHSLFTTTTSTQPAERKRNI